MKNDVIIVKSDNYELYDDDHVINTQWTKNQCTYRTQIDGQVQWLQGGIVHRFLQAAGMGRGHQDDAAEADGTGGLDEAEPISSMTSGGDIFFLWDRRKKNGRSCLKMCRI